MADTKGDSARRLACNDRCGCPNPCPGGTACRCTSMETSSGDHKKCSCGEHCSCNPCGCRKTELTGTGKVFCKCGPGCTCVTCAA